MSIHQLKENLRISMEYDKNYHYIGGILIGIVLGVLIVFSNYIAIAITIALAGFLVISRSSLKTVLFPLKIVSIFILISPFSKTIYLRDTLYNMQGFKIVQLLAILLIFISIINYDKSVKMPKIVFYFSLLIAFVFTISVFRSLDYLDMFNKYYFSEDKLTTGRYIMSHYIKPIIYMIPFIVIIKFVKNEKDLKYIYNIIHVTIIFFAIHILYIYAFHVDNKFDLSEVSDYYATYYGMHRNEMASFFIVGLPIAFGKYFLNKKLFNIIFVFIIISAIGILFSRAAYMSTVIAILGYLLISKRAKVLPIIIIIVIALPIFLYAPIMERASQGVRSKDREEISAGRIDHIWIPLIEEYSKSPQKLIFGSGRYAIQSSEAASKSYILQDISHPHNMYLEMIIDAGLVGIIIFMAFYYIILINAYNTLAVVKNERLKEYLYANIISIICFMISGITDRSLFPKEESVFIWIILACTIVTCALANNIDLKFKRDYVTG